MNRFESLLFEKVNAAVPELARVAPSLAIQVHVKAEKVADLKFGQVYDFYDLASLTKILFTASLAIEVSQVDSQFLFTDVREDLPWWKSATTPAELFTHSAGLTWWLPIYKKLKGPMTTDARWPQLEKMLARLPKVPKKTRPSVYSDLDLWLLGAQLQARIGLDLLSLWQALSDEWQIPHLFFHPGNVPRYGRERYAPTEICPWRGRLLQGEVHDENTWALAGVAPHAGLFGDIDSVSQWGLQLRHRLLQNAKTVGPFVRRQVQRKLGDWGYGFMKPTKGKASCGRYFSSESFGHTGFTGTSYWFDPKQDLQVVILSNRVHPSRTNADFVKLRPQLHDWICELLQSSGAI